MLRYVRGWLYVNKIRPGAAGAFTLENGGKTMSKYLHVAKHNVDAVLRKLSLIQASNGTFYNIAVLPYRGRTLDPDQYVTIKIG